MHGSVSYHITAKIFRFVEDLTLQGTSSADLMSYFRIANPISFIHSNFVGTWIMFASEIWLENIEIKIQVSL